MFSSLTSSSSLRQSLNKALTLCRLCYWPFAALVWRPLEAAVLISLAGYIFYSSRTLWSRMFSFSRVMSLVFNLMFSLANSLFFSTSIVLLRFSWNVSCCSDYFSWWGLAVGRFFAYSISALWIISFLLNTSGNYPGLLPAKANTGSPLTGCLFCVDGRLMLSSDGSWGLGLRLPFRRLCSISSSLTGSRWFLTSFPLFFFLNTMMFSFYLTGKGTFTTRLAKACYSFVKGCSFFIDGCYSYIDY